MSRIRCVDRARSDDTVAGISLVRDAAARCVEVEESVLSREEIERARVRETAGIVDHNVQKHG